MSGQWLVRDEHGFYWGASDGVPEPGDVVYWCDDTASILRGYGTAEVAREVNELSGFVTYVHRFGVREAFNPPVPLPKLTSWHDDLLLRGARRLTDNELEVLAREVSARHRDESHLIELIDPRVFDALRARPDLLQTLEGRTFELFLAEVLSRLGYTIDLQRGTKDGGVDIFAVRRDDAFGVHRYLLQAKRWRAPVGVEPIRELLFLQHHHHVTKSCLVTTSRFTSGAWKLAAQYVWQLDLKDMRGLREWLNLLPNC